MHKILPAIWLVVSVFGLPQLSETAYTPSLPEIAISLKIAESTAEYTLAIYLFGFAIGTLFWGTLSDRIGRRPCLMIGLITFVIGCFGCYFSENIQSLMVSRLFQALGASVGSVVAQAVCRDAFSGITLSKVYAWMVGSQAVFSAIGPVIGGFIAEYYHWHDVFLFITSSALILTILVAIKLPETHKPQRKQEIVSPVTIAISMAKDKNVLGCGLIVALCNGIFFSYFAEGSFYLIKNLHLTPSQYGLSFIAISISTMLGGMVSSKIQDLYKSDDIINIGLKLILLASAIFSIIAGIYVYVAQFPMYMMIFATIVCQMGISFSTCIAKSNALSSALRHYTHCIGTASSILGCFYYALTALVTFGMGAIHNDTLLTMPLYFFGISLFMMIMRKLALRYEH